MKTKQKLAVLAAAVSTPVAFAGDIADAINNNSLVQGASADLISIGQTVAGLVVIAVVFGAAFKVFRKGG